MPRMDYAWAALAARQHGLIARRQLRTFGVDHGHVRNRVTAGRWALRSDRVISTFTGPLQFVHRLWLGVLHAGGNALVTGLSAAMVQGLRHWDRDDVSILVDDRLDFEPVPGIVFVRTRRNIRELQDPRHTLPLCRIEPAILLFAGYTRSLRTAQGAIAASIQQRLTTPAALRTWIRTLRPLRRAQLFRTMLDDIDGGSHSLGEREVVRFCRDANIPPPHRQRRRRDRAGRLRFTDCEWQLPNGRTVVLEIDGAFHMDAAQWEDDLARARALSSPERSVLHCTTRELRENPERVFRDLAAHGVTPGLSRLPEAAV